MLSVERRLATRLPIELDVHVEGAAQRFSSTTANISTGGVFVVTHHDIPVGTHVMLSFKLRANDPASFLEVIGVVKWRRRFESSASAAADAVVPGLGIAFFCLDPEVKRILGAFCSVREPLYSESGEFDLTAATASYDDDPE